MWHCTELQSKVTSSQSITYTSYTSYIYPLCKKTEHHIYMTSSAKIKKQSITFTYTNRASENKPSTNLQQSINRIGLYRK
ncbi:hypothetical protein HYC85_006257 [Camellia sinensis]|uniref:Uncharacterized protein n=1 Tax=Camellia sinensis TaxID=4442 RepID=A0A7J7HMF5_CAMSI|nr:hypothetical protein HYC85_006257 [Camellia sinensis]